MADDEIRYDRMVETALRGVVKDALTQAEKDGLPGDHHFYITFKTGHPGVRIPGYLRAQYTDEMTIVLQYQYLHLEVDDIGFSVSLSFNNKHEHLRIPFVAVTTFADPSVNFALQFQPLSDEEVETDEVADGAVPSADSGSGTVTPLAALESGETNDSASGKKGRGPDRSTPAGNKSENAETESSPASSADEMKSGQDGGDSGEEPSESEESKVVTLDKFRKK